jgi:hypothetical protein
MKNPNPRVEAAFGTVARVETGAPSPLYYQIRNVLLMSERRKTASPKLCRPRSFAISRSCQFDWSLQGMMRALWRWRATESLPSTPPLSGEALPLATLDCDLETAALTEGVALFGA